MEKKEEIVALKVWEKPSQSKKNGKPSKISKKIKEILEREKNWTKKEEILVPIKMVKDEEDSAFKLSKSLATLDEEVEAELMRSLK